MTKEMIDKMWQRAMQESVLKGEMFTRYEFAKAIAMFCADIADNRCAIDCKQSAIYLAIKREFQF